MASHHITCCFHLKVIGNTVFMQFLFILSQYWMSSWGKREVWHWSDFILMPTFSFVVIPSSETEKSSFLSDQRFQALWKYLFIPSYTNPCLVQSPAKKLLLMFVLHRIYLFCTEAVWTVVWYELPDHLIKPPGSWKPGEVLYNTASEQT